MPPAFSWTGSSLVCLGKFQERWQGWWLVCNPSAKPLPLPLFIPSTPYAFRTVFKDVEESWQMQDFDGASFVNTSMICDDVMIFQIILLGFMEIFSGIGVRWILPKYCKCTSWSHYNDFFSTKTLAFVICF